MKKWVAVFITCFVVQLLFVGTFKAQENNWIQGISVEGKNGNYVVQGKITAKNKDAIYYTVEDGHQELISQQKLSIVNGSFQLEVKIKEELLPKNGSLIIYFSKNDKETYSVVLEKFS